VLEAEAHKQEIRNAERLTRMRPDASLGSETAPPGSRGFYPIETSERRLSANRIRITVFEVEFGEPPRTP
jgi:hypothetical protein